MNEKKRITNTITVRVTEKDTKVTFRVSEGDKDILDTLNNLNDGATFIRDAIRHYTDTEECKRRMQFYICPRRFVEMAKEVDSAEPQE